MNLSPRPGRRTGGDQAPGLCCSLAGPGAAAGSREANTGVQVYPGVAVRVLARAPLPSPRVGTGVRCAPPLRRCAPPRRLHADAAAPLARPLPLRRPSGRGGCRPSPPTRGLRKARAAARAPKTPPSVTATTQRCHARQSPLVSRAVVSTSLQSPSAVCVMKGAGAKSTQDVAITPPFHQRPVFCRATQAISGSFRACHRASASTLTVPPPFLRAGAVDVSRTWPLISPFRPPHPSPAPRAELLQYVFLCHFPSSVLYIISNEFSVKRTLCELEVQKQRQKPQTNSGGVSRRHRLARACLPVSGSGRGPASEGRALPLLPPAHRLHLDPDLDPAACPGEPRRGLRGGWGLWGARTDKTVSRGRVGRQDDGETRGGRGHGWVCPSPTCGRDGEVPGGGGWGTRGPAQPSSLAGSWQGTGSPPGRLKSY